MQRLARFIMSTSKGTHYHHTTKYHLHDGRRYRMCFALTYTSSLCIVIVVILYRITSPNRVSMIWDIPAVPARPLRISTKSPLKKVSKSNIITLKEHAVPHDLPFSADAIRQLSDFKISCSPSNILPLSLDKFLSSRKSSKRMDIPLILSGMESI